VRFHGLHQILLGVKKAVSENRIAGPIIRPHGILTAHSKKKKIKKGKE